MRILHIRAEIVALEMAQRAFPLWSIKNAARNALEEKLIYDANERTSQWILIDVLETEYHLDCAFKATLEEISKKGSRRTRNERMRFDTEVNGSLGSSYRDWEEEAKRFYWGRSIRRMAREEKQPVAVRFKLEFERLSTPLASKRDHNGKLLDESFNISELSYYWHYVQVFRIRILSKTSQPL